MQDLTVLQLEELQWEIIQDNSPEDGNVVMEKAGDKLAIHPDGLIEYLN